MSEFDSDNCNEGCRYSKNADMFICRKCQNEYDMPRNDCCLEWCGAFDFCKDCKNGIYKE